METSRTQNICTQKQNNNKLIKNERVEGIIKQIPMAQHILKKRKEKSHGSLKKSETQWSANTSGPVLAYL